MPPEFDAPDDDVNHVVDGADEVASVVDVELAGSAVVVGTAVVGWPVVGTDVGGGADVDVVDVVAAGIEVEDVVVEETTAGDVVVVLPPAVVVVTTGAGTKANAATPPFFPTVTGPEGWLATRQPATATGEMTHVAPTGMPGKAAVWDTATVTRDDVDPAIADPVHVTSKSNVAGALLSAAAAIDSDAVANALVTSTCAVEPDGTTTVCGPDVSLHPVGGVRSEMAHLVPGNIAGRTTLPDPPDVVTDVGDMPFPQSTSNVNWPSRMTLASEDSTVVCFVTRMKRRPPRRHKFRSRYCFVAMAGLECDYVIGEAARGVYPHTKGHRCRVGYDLRAWPVGSATR